MIGRGYEDSDTKQIWPYEVGIHFDAPSLPLLVADGSGRAEAGSFQPLQAIRGPQFATHVRVCRCEWLVALAEEEEERGVPFTPEEIHERWQQRSEAAR